MNIVLIGHVCIDHNITENATYTGWGSSVLYMAHYLQGTHNITPTVVSSYGPDLIPYLAGISILPDTPNKPETLVYENDTLSIPRVWKAHKVEYAFPPDLTPAVTKLLEMADIIIVAPLLPNYSVAYLQSLIGHTKPDALKLLCPQGYFRTIDQDGLVSSREFTEAADIIPLFDLVVYSEEDRPQALQIAVNWERAMPDAKVIVTQGSKGASIVEKSQARHIPTQAIDPKDIVDSVGCGDVFAVTVAYKYQQIKDLDQAVKQAHKSAALKLRGTPRK